MLFSSKTEIYREKPEVRRELRSEILYDPDNMILFGRYAHEIAAYRAKRAWHTTLSVFFLLEEGTDYSIEVERPEELEGAVEIRSYFYSACGRYAFWRLTNDQAPEAQYLLEAAHIPQSELNSLEFLTAPDLEELGISSPARAIEEKPSWLTPLRNILKKLGR